MYSLLLEIAKIDWILVAKIVIFQLVNFDNLLVKNDYLNSEKRTHWILRVEKNDLF